MSEKKTRTTDDGGKTSKCLRLAPAELAAAKLSKHTSPMALDRQRACRAT